MAAGKISAPKGRRQILKLAPIQDPAWFQRDGEPVLRDTTDRATRDAFTGTRMAFEVAPNPMGDPELYARWRALPDATRVDISHAVARHFYQGFKKRCAFDAMISPSDLRTSSKAQIIGDTEVRRDRVARNRFKALAVEVQIELDLNHTLR